MNATEQLLTLPKASAEIPGRDGLPITVEALRRWCRQGKIPCVKIGGAWLIPRSQFEDWKAGLWQPPGRDRVKKPTARSDAKSARERLRAKGFCS